MITVRSWPQGMQSPARLHVSRDGTVSVEHDYARERSPSAWRDTPDKFEQFLALSDALAQGRTAKRGGERSRDHPLRAENARLRRALEANIQTTDALGSTVDALVSKGGRLEAELARSADLRSTLETERSLSAGERVRHEVELRAVRSFFEAQELGAREAERERSYATRSEQAQRSEQRAALEEERAAARSELDASARRSAALADELERVRRERDAAALDLSTAAEREAASVSAAIAVARSAALAERLTQGDARSAKQESSARRQEARIESLERARTVAQTQLEQSARAAARAQRQADADIAALRAALAVASARAREQRSALSAPDVEKARAAGAALRLCAMQMADANAALLAENDALRARLTTVAAEPWTARNLTPSAFARSRRATAPSFDADALGVLDDLSGYGRRAREGAGPRGDDGGGDVAAGSSQTTPARAQ